MSCRAYCGHGGMLCGEPDCTNEWRPIAHTITTAQHTTLRDASPPTVAVHVSNAYERLSKIEQAVSLAPLPALDDYEAMRADGRREVARLRRAGMSRSVNGERARAVTLENARRRR